MSRVLLLLIAVLVLVWLLRRALAARKPRGPGRPGTPGVPAPELVACAHCGVHLPKNEAIAGPETAPPRYFCSEEHLRVGTG